MRFLSKSCVSYWNLGSLPTIASCTEETMNKTQNPWINNKKFPIGVAVHHRVVAAVGVAVEALRREGALNLRVGAEEAADDGVVESGVHVDDTKLVVVLMACESAVEAETFVVADLQSDTSYYKDF